MRYFIVIASTLLSLSAFADETLSSTVDAAAPTPIAEVQPATVGAEIQTAKPHHSQWLGELMAQVHSVAGESSPWVGLAILAPIAKTFHLGVRGFIPGSISTDKGTYTVQLVSRFDLGQANTHFFLEPTFSANLAKLVFFHSEGLSLGLTNRFTPTVQASILGGVEFTRNIVDSIGIQQVGRWVVYPKFALSTQIGF